jgi:hypothetical protein
VSITQALTAPRTLAGRAWPAHHDQAAANGDPNERRVVDLAGESFDTATAWLLLKFAAGQIRMNLTEPERR